MPNPAMTVIGVLIVCIAAAPVLAQGEPQPIAYYSHPANGMDDSGNGYDGTPVNVVAITDYHGDASGAGQFNGTDAWVDIPSPPKPALPVTIMGWVRMDSYSTGGGNIVFTNDIQNGNAYYWGVDLSVSATGAVSARYNNGYAAPSTRHAKASADSLVTLGRWHHVAGVIRGRNNISLYVDGVEVDGTYSGTANSLLYSSANGRIGNGLSPFHIPLHGRIDEVRFFDQALSAQDILFYYCDFLNLHSADWVSMGAYEGNRYFRSAYDTDAGDAITAMAMDGGAHLVSIGSAGENGLVAAAADSAGVPVYIGLINESLADTVWAWTTGEPLDYVNWDAGQPDDGGGTYGYAILGDGVAPGSWTADGGWEARPFVIEAEGPAEDRPAAAGTDTTDGNTVWGLAGSPYTLLNDFVVATGDTLTVEAGVEILLQDSAEIRVLGHLACAGTAQDSVRIHTSDQSLDVAAIRLAAAGCGADFAYTAISWAYYGIDVSAPASILRLTNSAVTSTVGGIRADGGTGFRVEITDCDFRDNTAGALLFTGCDAKVIRSSFVGNANGVANYAALRGSNVFWRIEDCTITNNNGGIHLAEQDSLSGNARPASGYMHNTVLSGNNRADVENRSRRPFDCAYNTWPAAATAEMAAGAQNIATIVDHQDDAAWGAVDFLRWGETWHGADALTGTRWTIANSPYTADGYTVAAGDTLIIEAGVEVQLGASGLVVAGTLFCRGTAQDSVRFTGWALGSYDHCDLDLEYCSFSSAGVGAGSKTSTGSSSVNIRHCSFSGPDANVSSAVNPGSTYTVDLVVDYSRFEGCDYGIASQGDARLRNNAFVDNADAVVHGFGQLLATDCLITGNTRGFYFPPVPSTSTFAVHRSTLDNPLNVVNESTVEADFTGNLWDEATTAQMAAGQPVTSVQGSVDYSGWIAVGDFNPPELTLETGSFAPGDTLLVPEGQNVVWSASDVDNPGDPIEYAYQLDGVTSDWLASGEAYLPPLLDGNYTFVYMARDVAANVAADSFSFVVDVSPPDAWVTVSPDTLVPVGSPITIGWTGFDAVTPTDQLLYSWRFDTDEWSGAAADTTLEISTLSPGNHVFEVFAIDLVGRVSDLPAAATFTVDVSGGLLLAYDFEGDVADSSGHGADGMLSGRATAFGALEVHPQDSDETYCIVPGGVVENLADFTIATFAAFDSLAVGAGLEDPVNTICSISADTLVVGVAEDLFVVRIAGEEFSFPRTFETRTLYHLALRRTGDRLDLFVDGTLADTQPVTTAFLYAPAGEFLLGHKKMSNQSSFDTSQGLHGRLDNFRLFGYAVDDYDISLLAQEIPDGEDGTLRLLDARGNPATAYDYDADQKIYFEVVDHDRDFRPDLADYLEVVVTNLDGDREFAGLVETDTASGVFRGDIAVAIGPGVMIEDGVVEFDNLNGGDITVTYRDVVDGNALAHEVAAPATITADDAVVWRAADSPILIEGTFALAHPGMMLTIEPGVEVIMGPNALLSIPGTLNCLGTAQDSVVFRAAAPVPGTASWRGIAAGSNTTITMAYTRVENAERVFAYNDAMSISAHHCLLRDNGTVDDNVDNARLSMFSCVVEDIHGWAVHTGRGSATIDSCIIRDCGIGAVYFEEGGLVNISNSRLENNPIGVELRSPSGYTGTAMHVNNTLLDNRVLNVNNRSSFALDGTGNRWDAATIAEMAAGATNITSIFDGHDDPQYGLVDFSGWISDVDQTPPLLSLDLSPVAAAGDTIFSSEALEFAWSATDDVSPAGEIEYAHSLDGVASAWGSTGYALVDSLPDGLRSFAYTARDAAGNVAADTLAFLVEASAPETWFVAGPDSMVILASDTLTFTCLGSDGTNAPGSLLYSWNGYGYWEEPSTATSGTYNYPEGGTWTVRVAAVDAFGRIDPTPATWTVTVSPNNAALVDYRFETTADDDGVWGYDGALLGDAVAASVLLIDDGPGAGRVQVPEGPLDRTGDFTVATLFALDRLHLVAGTEQPLNTICSLLDDDLLIAIGPDGLVTRIGGNEILFPHAFVDSTLYHLAVRRFGTTLDVFLDGAKLFSDTTIPESLDGSLVLGQRILEGETYAPEQGLAGRLDNFLLYDYAAADAAIAELSADRPLGSPASIEIQDPDGVPLDDFDIDALSYIQVQVVDPDFASTLMRPVMMVCYTEPFSPATADTEFLQIDVSNITGSTDINLLPAPPVSGDGTLQYGLGNVVIAAIYTDPLVGTGLGGLVREEIVSTGDAVVNWTLAESPIHILEEFYVGPEVTLVIDSGVRVLMGNNVEIYVEGSLVCNGTPTDSVYFEPVAEEDVPAGIGIYEGGSVDASFVSVSGFETAFMFDRSPAPSAIAHSRISGSDIGISATLAQDFSLVGCEILDCALGVELSQSTVRVDSCLVARSTNTGVALRDGNSAFSACAVIDNSSGFHLSGSVAGPDSVVFHDGVIANTSLNIQVWSDFFADFTSNTWDTATTVEMDAGAPNITSIFDGLDDPQYSIVDFSGWVSNADVTPPVLSLSGSVADSSTALTDTLVFTWSGTDNATVPEDIEFSTRYSSDETNMPVEEQPWDEWGLATGTTIVSPDDGLQSFQLRGRDQAGNEAVLDPIGFLVDTNDPETWITAGPDEGASVGSGEVTFAWSGSDPGTLPVALLRWQWRLNGTAWNAATSDTTYTYFDLAEGPHTFEVRTVDRAERIDATPALRGFTVVSGQVVAGPMTTDTTLTAAAGPYLVQGDVIVAGIGTPDLAARLTIEAGAEVHFAPGARLIIGDEAADGPGSLAVGNGALLTSDRAVPAAGDWAGIVFTPYAEDGASLLQGCIVEYAGDEDPAILIDGANPVLIQVTVRHAAGDGIRITGTGDVEITGSTVANCAGIGIEAGGAPDASIYDNTISACAGAAVRLHPSAVGDAEGNVMSGNGRDIIEVAGGVIDRNAFWPVATGPLHITGTVKVMAPTPVDPPAILRIDAGVEARFASGTALVIGDDSGGSLPGALVVDGTLAAPVILASAEASPMPGDWHGVHLTPNCEGAQTHLRFAFISEGGGQTGADLYVEDCTPATLERLRLSRSVGYGLAAAAPGVVIRHSDFEANDIGGVSNYGTDPIDAGDNWWGDASGPSGAGAGTGQRVGTNVIFAPWLVQPGTIDNPPLLTILTGPEPGALLLVGNTELTWTAIDDWADPAAITYSWRLDGGAFSAWSPETAVSLTAIPDGLHTVTIRARDDADHVAAADRSFRVDLIPPNVVLIDGPDKEVVTLGTDVTMAWAGYDSTATAAELTYAYRLDGWAWLDVGNDTSVVLTGLGLGLHTFSVRVTDAAGRTDPTPAQIEFTVVAYGTVVAQDVTGSTTWDVGGSPYLLQGDVVVRSLTSGTPAILTIESGVVVHFQPGSRLVIGAEDAGAARPGALVTRGTALQPVLMTVNSSTPAPGDWYGIEFTNWTHDAASSVYGCVVEYAGLGGSAIRLDSASPTIANSIVRDSGGDGILLTGSSNPQLLGTTVRDCSGYGIYADAGTAPTVASCTLTGNGNAAMSLAADAAGAIGQNTANGNAGDHVEIRGGILSSTANWSASSLPYVLAGPLAIEASSTTPTLPAQLSVAAGTTVRFASTAGLTVGGHDGSQPLPGILAVAGTASAPVLFTAHAATWPGLLVNPAAVPGVTSFSHLVVERVTSGVAGIRIDGAAPILQDCLVRNCSGDGMAFAGSAGGAMVNCRIENNNGYGLVTSGPDALPAVSGLSVAGQGIRALSLHANAVAVLSSVNLDTPIIGIRGGTIDRDLAWTALGYTYRVQGPLDVAAASAEDPPVVFTIAAGARVEFAAGSGLTVGAADASGRGGALAAEGTALEPVTFTGTSTVRGAWPGIRLTPDCDATGTRLSYCVIEYAGAGFGANLVLEGAAPARLDHLLLANGSGFGLRTLGTSAAIHQSDFVLNSAGGLQNGGGGTIDATDNWWSSPAGPSAGTQQVVGDVLFDPWLAAAATVDLPPVVSLTGAPAEGSWVPAATVSFTWQGSDNVAPAGSLMYSHRLDGVAWSAWSPDLGTSVDVPAGRHRFEVRALDPQGQISTAAASSAFGYDLTPPVATLAGGPQPGKSLPTTATTFTWTGADNVVTDAEIVYSWLLDGGEASAWTNATQAALVGLAPGAHTFSLFGRDPAGNTSVAVDVPFSVDFVDLVATTLAAPAAAVLGGSLAISWDVANSGVGAAAPWTDSFVLRRLDTPAADVVLGNHAHAEGLAGGFSLAATDTFTIPANMAAGTYAVVIAVDSGASVPEEGAEDNNTRASQEPTLVTVPPHADLVVTGIVPPVSGWSGLAVELTWTISNAGTDTARAPWVDSVSLSADETPGTDTLLGAFSHTVDLAPGATYVETRTVVLPDEITGNFWFVVKTNAGNTVQEMGDEDNNATAATAPSVVQYRPAPDLIVSAVTAPLSAVAADTMTVSWTVRNTGSVATDSPVWYDHIYVSAVPGLGTGAVLVGEFANNTLLPPQASYTVVRTVMLPSSLVGPYYVVVVTDAAGHVDENQAEGNNANVTAEPVVLSSPTPVLAAGGLRLDPPNPLAGQYVDVSWYVENIGTGTFTATTWRDAIHLSADGTIGAGSELVPGGLHGVSLAPGARDSLAVTVRLPHTGSGPRQLIVQPNADGVLAAAGVQATLAIVVGPFLPPDLVATHLAAPDTVETGRTYNLSWQVTNGGAGGTIPAAWSDILYMSADSILEPAGDTEIGAVLVETELLPGAGYGRALDVTIPSGLQGSLRFYVIVDAADSQPESGAVESNLAATGSIPVRIVPPDLVVTALGRDGIPAAGVIDISWTTTNQGAGTTWPGAWDERFYLSADATLETTSDRLLGVRRHTGALVPGAAYADTARLAIPWAVAAGNYHLFAVTDAGDEVLEIEGENNNTRSLAVQILISYPPDLRITDANAPTALWSGTRVVVDWSVHSLMTELTATAWTDAVYLSADTLYSPGSDILLGTIGHARPAGYVETYQQAMEIRVPFDGSGSYTLFVVADSGEQIDEAGVEANNRRSFAVTVQPTPAPDLQVSYAAVPDTVEAGTVVSLPFIVRNGGAATPAGYSWSDGVHLSVDNQFDATGDAVLFDARRTGFAGEQGRQVDVAWSVGPELSGTVYLFFSADYQGEIYERGIEANNRVMRPVVVVPPVRRLPDLFVSALAAPDTAQVPGDPLTVSWTVTNQSAYPTKPGQDYWNDEVYLSADGILDANDTRLAVIPRTSGLSPGASYERTTPVTVPPQIDGNRYLILITDRLGAIDELDETANTAAVPLHVQRLPVDLVVAGVTAPATLRSGQPLTVQWTVVNNGTGPARAPRWFDNVFISTDQVLDGGDLLLGSYERVGDLAAGASYAGSVTTVVTLGVTGTHYAIVKTDKNNNIYEHDAESNNASAAATFIDITLPPPADLVVTSVSAPSLATVDEDLTVQWQVDNNGGFGTDGDWIDAVYLSLDEGLDAGDLLLGIMAHVGGLAPGGSYLGSLTVTMPPPPGPTPAGDRHLIIATDRDNNIFESDDANNAAMAGNTTALAYHIVDPGTPVGDLVVGGGRRSYYATAEANVDLRIDFSSANGTDIIGLYGAYDRVPTAFDYDLEVEIESGEGFAVVPGGTGGGLYLSVSGIGTVTNGGFVLETSEIAYTIARFTPRQAGNAGIVRLDVSGGRLGDVQDAWLAAGPQRIDASWIEPVSSSLARPGFDLRGALPGSYELVFVGSTGDTARSTVPLRIVGGTGPAAYPGLLGPSVLRQGNHGEFGLNLRNVGDADARDIVVRAEIAAGSLYEMVDEPDDTETHAASGLGELIVFDLLPLGREAQLDFRLYTGSNQKITVTPLVDVGRLTVGADGATGLFAERCRVAFAAAYGTGPVDAGVWAATWDDAWLANSSGTARTLLSKLEDVAATVVAGLGAYGLPQASAEALQEAVLTAHADLVGQAAEIAAGSDWFEASRNIVTIHSWDPNEKHGPRGTDDAFIVAGEPLTYTLYFENVSTATLPAQKVRITDHLDIQFDRDNSWLGEVVFGDIRYTPEPGRKQISDYVTLPNGLRVQIDGGIDPSHGVATWTLETRNPVTNLPPVDPFKGFLPPNDDNGRGEGHVSFVIGTNPELSTGATIPNSCSIVFDNNNPIVTNQVVGTIRAASPDVVCPAAGIDPAPPLEGGTTAISATIANSGELPASDVAVQIYDGDPDHGGTALGAAIVVPALLAGQSTVVTVPWSPTRIAGVDSILVVVDPLDTVSEADEGNNRRWLTFAVEERSFTMHLADGLNMISLPLETSLPHDARSFCSALGADMIARVLPGGRFSTYLAVTDEGENFSVEPTQGYLVSVPGGSHPTFTGISPLGDSAVRQGLNMLAVPLHEDGYSTGDFVADIGAAVVLAYDPAADRFIPYAPGVHDEVPFVVQGGYGYIVSAPRDTSVNFEGLGWHGQQPLSPLAKSADANSNGTPVLACAGRVVVTDRRGKAFFAYREASVVVVVNERTGRVARSELNLTNGSFGTAFVDINDAAANRAGDILAIRLETPGGEPISDLGRYHVTDADIELGYASLGAFAIDVPPVRTLVEQNYPNPFNPETTIHFQLAESDHVSLKVYDIRGRFVCTLVDGFTPAGYYQVIWNGRDAKDRQMASGVYLYRFDTARVKTARKMLLLK